MMGKSLHQFPTGIVPHDDICFAPPPQPFLPVKGTDALFPVHRIYCVGQNYADHAIEMGGDPTRNPPFFFQKNPDSLVIGGGDFPIRRRPRTCITRSNSWWR